MRIATRYLVRPMTLADVPQVMEIERESFPAIWPPTAFKRELQQNRLAQYIVVLEKNPAFVGDRQVPQPEHQSHQSCRASHDSLLRSVRPVTRGRGPQLWYGSVAAKRSSRTRAWRVSSAASPRQRAAASPSPATSASWPSAR